MGLLQSLASLAMVYFVIRATNYLMEGRWAEDVIRFGDKVWKIQLAAFIAVAVCVVLAMIWVMLAVVGLIVTLVVSIIAQIMFLQYLGRASRVF